MIFILAPSLVAESQWLRYEKQLSSVELSGCWVQWLEGWGQSIPAHGSRNWMLRSSWLLHAD